MRVTLHTILESLMQAGAYLLQGKQGFCLGRQFLWEQRRPVKLSEETENEMHHQLSWIQTVTKLLEPELEEPLELPPCAHIPQSAKVYGALSTPREEGIGQTLCSPMENGYLHQDCCASHCPCQGAPSTVLPSAATAVAAPSLLLAKRR